MSGVINTEGVPLDPLHAAVDALDRDVARLERLHRSRRWADPLNRRFERVISEAGVAFTAAGHRKKLDEERSSSSEQRHYAEIDPTEAEKKAELKRLINQYYPLTGGGASWIGDWSTGFVVAIGDASFAVRPTPDGMEIEPSERTPLMLAYAHDATVLIQEARRGLRDAVLYHKLGVGSRPSLASAVLEAIIEHQTRRARL